MPVTGEDPRVRQRAEAEARASFAPAGARTEPRNLFETGGLRWRFPRSTDPCEAVIVNTGGGVAGGDSYRIGLMLAAGAAVETTTAAAEKIYRSDGPPARIATSLSSNPARASPGCRRKRSCSTGRGSTASS